MEIGVWGDSITYGKCDSEALGWVGRIRKSYPIGENGHVYNRGIGGDTSEDLLKRFAVEAESIEPEVIVFAIGINDSKYPAGATENLVPIEKFKENMRSLIKQAKAHSAKIYIVSCTSVVDESPRSSGTRFTNEQIAIYNSFLKELAESESLQYIDISDVLDISTDLHDGLHPNAGGYEKLATVIGSQIT